MEKVIFSFLFKILKNCLHCDLEGHFLKTNPNRQFFQKEILNKETLNFERRDI